MAPTRAASNCMSWVVWYAVVQHTLWAAMLLLGPAAKDITAIHTASTAISNHLALAGLFAIVAAYAASSLLRKRNDMWDLMGLLPQQILLLISAAGAITAMISGQFADGVPRPRAFLVADQSPAVLLAGFHTWFLWTRYVRGRNG